MPETGTQEYFASEAATYTKRMNELRARQLEHIMSSVGRPVVQEDINKYLNEDYDPNFLELIKSCPTVLSRMLLSIGYKLFDRMQTEAKITGVDASTFDDLDFPRDDDPLSKKHSELLLYPPEMDDPLLKDAISLIRAEAIAHEQVLKKSPTAFLTREFYLALAQEYQRCGLNVPDQLQFVLNAAGQKELQQREKNHDLLARKIFEVLTAVKTEELIDEGVHPKMAERGGPASIQQLYREAEPLRQQTFEKIRRELPQLLENNGEFVPWLLGLESQGKTFFEHN